MPICRITVTKDFQSQFRGLSNFCRSIRQIVADTFKVDVSKVSVKLENYAPGCEDGRPPVAVEVSIGEGERTPIQQELVDVIGAAVKDLTDQTVRGRVDEVKVILDLERRKIAVVNG